MYLTYGFWLLSFLKHPVLMVAFVLLMSTRLFLSNNKKELFIWIVLSIVFISHHQFGLPNLEKYYRVDSIGEYKIIVRNSFNYYEIKNTSLYEIGDVLKVEDNNPFNSPTNYQLNKKIIGTIDETSVTFLKRNVSLKKSFWNNLRNHEFLKEFFDKEIDSIFSLLSLQLVGLVRIVKVVYRKFFDEDRFYLIEIFISFIYGYFFGFGFGVMRILLRTLIKDRSKVIAILLLLYPHGFYDPAFNLVFLPYLIKNSTHVLQHVNEKILRCFMLLRLLGRLQPIEILLFPALSYYAGIIVLTSLLHLFTVSSFLLKFGTALMTVPRFLIVGAPSFLWLWIFLKRDVKKQFIGFMLMVCVLTYYPFHRVSMINVYQGDATLITLPFNSITILIDTGRQSAYKSLKRTLYQHGIKKLDYLVITHDDLDHYENRDVILREFKVSHLIQTKAQSVPFMTQLLQDKEYEEDNGNSLILLHQTKRRNFLFMGDAGIEQELEIIKRYPHFKVDILKLGHHGSKTSTGINFLETLQPKLVLISSDPKMYGHPHPEVMRSLYDFKIPSVETSKEGNVTVLMLPIFDLVVSQRGGFGIMK